MECRIDDLEQDEIAKNKHKHFVYIIECSDGSLYTGWTTNLEKRMKTHNQGKGAKYTRGRTPVTLVYYEEFENKEDALKREKAVQKLKREKKISMIKQFL